MVTFNNAVMMMMTVVQSVTLYFRVTLVKNLETTSKISSTNEMVICYIYRKFHGEYKCHIFLSPLISPGSFPDFTSEQTSCLLQTNSAKWKIRYQSIMTSLFKGVSREFPVPYNINLTSGLITNKFCSTRNWKFTNHPNAK